MHPRVTCTPVIPELYINPTCFPIGYCSDILSSGKTRKQTRTCTHSYTLAYAKYNKIEMKFLITVVAVALAVALVSAAPQTKGVHKFTTKYDDVSLEEILHSERLLGNYFDCLMNTKPCTPDGAELKKALPLALKENCAGCSPKQKSGAETVIQYLSSKKPDLWKKLEDKYDPSGVYRNKHAALAARKGIKV